MMAIAAGSPFRVSRGDGLLTMTDELARHRAAALRPLAVDIPPQADPAPLAAPTDAALRVVRRAARARRRARAARPRCDGAAGEGAGASARRPRPLACGRGHRAGLGPGELLRAGAVGHAPDGTEPGLSRLLLTAGNARRESPRRRSRPAARGRGARLPGASLPDEHR